jgi:hypothetical protein
MTKTRTYSELSQFDTFEDRYEYLKLDGVVGHATFGFDRYINQGFYTSHEWKQARRDVIVRDNGCDLGIFDRPIAVAMLVHHMNPMVAEDVIHGEEWLIDPEFLVLTTRRTHDAIHFGNDSLLPKTVIFRSKNDTKLW